MMKKILLSLIAVFIYLSASAHAVFIETALRGVKGQAHTVKVVYGEPDEHEVTSKWWWYKPGMEVNLTLTKPDGTKETLKTTANDNHLLATFTPDQDGVYHVSLHRDTERREGSKVQFQVNAIANIQVGNSLKGNEPSNISNELFVHAPQVFYKNNKEIAVTLYQKGQVAPNTAFQVISPSGWIRWVETDGNGVARFTPEWKGKYFVEVSKREKVSGEAYDEHSRATSMSIEVK